MNVIELVTKIKKEAKKAHIRLPDFIDVEDLENGRLCINGRQICIPSVWGVCYSKGLWVYFVTDNERGYICKIRKFNNEEEACEYVYDCMKLYIEAEKDEIAIREIIKKYGYSRIRAVKILNKISKQKDIFDEMLYCLRNDCFVENGIEIYGITARKLVEHRNFTLAEAYVFLSELRNNPNKAEELDK